MRKILVAFDGTEPAHTALATAADMARAFGATISVISVIPVHSGRVPVDPWDDASVHATELLDARRILRDQGIEAELIEPAGDPARTIERIAEEGGFDTIVVGSRELGTLDRMLLGSVSEHVVNHAHATVVVAR